MIGGDIMKFYLSALLVLGLAACTDDSGTNTPRDFGVEDMGMDLAATPDLPKEDVTMTPPEITLDVDVLLYERVEIGQKRTQSIFVTNVGTEDLVIGNVLLEELDRQGPSEFKPGAKWVSGTTIVPGNTFLELQVDYEPTDNETDRGTVTIVSNDADEPQLEVRLQTVNAYPDLDAPKLVRFGNVTPGMSETQRVFMYNRGAAPLNISAVVKTGLGPFAIQFIPTEPLPRILQRDEQYAFDLVYTPADTSVHRGTITLTTDDPNDSPYEIAVLGNSPTACLRLTPDGGDFGTVAEGTPITKEFTIFNCSDVLPLSISKVELVDDAGGIFTMNAVPTPVELGGFETSRFSISAVGVSTEAIGEVVIESTDSQSSPQTVQLRIRPVQ